MLLIVLFSLVGWTYISFNYNSWKTAFELFRMKNRPYKVECCPLEQSIREYMDKKYVWYKELILILRIKFETFINMPNAVYRFFKKGIQRWKRGWGDEDIWSIDGYLSNIIPPMLKRLKEIKRGVPIVVGKMKTLEEMEQAEKQWDEILDNIIWTFDISKKIQNNELAYFEQWTQEEADNYNKIWINWKHEEKPRAMTKEECEKYDKGWEMFKRYFYSLWD